MPAERVSYPVQVQAVNDLMARPPLNGDGKTPPPKLIIDRTGVGCCRRHLQRSRPQT
jgi:hypothetical protein